ncbi:MAG: hypothetical protein QXT38_02320 [Candidatus Aenigmatarchaeota archaeon]
MIVNEFKICLEKIKEIKEFAYVFNFDSYREVIHLIEELEKDKKLDWFEQIYLVDLILFDWLKIKYPLILEEIKSRYRLFVIRNSLSMEEKNQDIDTVLNIWSSRKEELGFDKAYEQSLENVLFKIYKLVGENINDYKVVMNILCFLTENFGFEKDFFKRGYFKNIPAVEIDFAINDLCPYNLKDILLKKFSENNSLKEKIINVNKFCVLFDEMFFIKRLFNLYNIEVYLGIKKYIFSSKKIKIESLNGLKNIFHLEDKFHSFKNSFIEHKFYIEEEKKLRFVPYIEDVDKFLLYYVSLCGENYYNKIENLYKEFFKAFFEKFEVNQDFISYYMKEVYEKLNIIKDFYKLI